MSLLKIFDVAGSAVSAQSQRLNVVASNLANADTVAGPDGGAYKARQVVFQTVLMGSAGGPGAGLGTGIARDVMTPGGRAQPALSYAQPHQTQLDNNTVDMDRERGAFVDNAVKFEATLRFINGSVRTLQEAMKSANQG